MFTDKQKQISVLTMNTVAFAVNFAVWTMFSVIGIKIKQELGLSETEFGLLIATPILTGSLVRLPLGLLADRFGGRIVYFIQMILVAIPTYGLSFADQYWQYLVIGLFVGLAGGSFAIGIAYTSAWFPRERQGTAMGIFGAGNAGAAVTNLVAPMIVVASGWRAVPEVYSLAMLIMAVLFWFATFPDPLHLQRQNVKTRLTLAQQLAPLTEPRVWRFGLAYYFVFGGFVALALWLPKYYMGEYGLNLKDAALITMLFVLPSGLIRALGGWMSDKWGGDRVTWIVFWVSIICLFIVSYPQTMLIVHGISEDISLDIGVGVVLFTTLILIIGSARYRQSQRLPQFSRSLPRQHGLGRRHGRGHRRAWRFFVAHIVRYRGRSGRRTQQLLYVDVRGVGRCDDLDLGSCQEPTGNDTTGKRKPACRAGSRRPCQRQTRKKNMVIRLASGGRDFLAYHRQVCRVSQFNDLHAGIVAVIRRLGGVECCGRGASQGRISIHHQ